ncbi:MAG: response regulator [Spirochaetes bacterium]|nr:response regulator [Spirochaetota bacterium]
MPKSILVIDDDQAILNSIQKQLKNEGFNIDLELDPEKGLEKVISNHYDLLLCDIRMKPISGIDVLKKIKAKNCNVPIIFITGFVDDIILEEIKRFGSNGLLKKPVRKSELIQSIYNLILLH